MSLFRGLFVRPDSTRGTTPVEARKSLAGAFQRLGSGAPRAGLLAAAQVVGTTGWAYSLPAVPMLLARGAADGVVLAGNDGALSVATSPAPATGSRIDIVYAIHHDVDQADADSEMVVSVAVGTPSGTPVAPSIPAGAMELARATVASTATNTLGATITQTAPYSGLAGADIIVPFGLASFAARIPDPPTGTRVFSTTENAAYLRVGGAWVEVWRDTGWISTGYGTVAGSTVNYFRIRRVGQVVQTRVAATLASLSVNTSGDIANTALCTVPSGFAPSVIGSLPASGVDRLVGGIVETDGSIQVAHLAANSVWSSVTVLTDYQVALGGVYFIG